jgi:hypothetical protein
MHFNAPTSCASMPPDATCAGEWRGPSRDERGSGCWTTPRGRSTGSWLVPRDGLSPAWRCSSWTAGGRSQRSRERAPGPLRPEPGRQRGPEPSAWSSSASTWAICWETVDSVWRSVRVPDELILVDDGSRTDETVRVIALLEDAARERGLPLRVLRQGNRGLAAARNRGLDAATGEFVSFLDGDDLIEPSFYRLACALLQEDPDLGGVAAWANMFGQGVPDAFWNAPQPELPLLLVENTVFVPLMMRTEVLRGLGGYDVRQRYNYEDWELGIRLLASGRPIVTIPAYLQRYRVRSDSLLHTLSHVQNQGMRELLLETHRETVSEFAVETPMLVEGELMRRVHARPAAAAAPRRVGVREWLEKAASAGRRLCAQDGPSEAGRRAGDEAPDPLARVPSRTVSARRHRHPRATRLPAARRERGRDARHRTALARGSRRGRGALRWTIGGSSSGGRRPDRTPSRSVSRRGGAGGPPRLTLPGAVVRGVPRGWRSDWSKRRASTSSKRRTGRRRSTTSNSAGRSGVAPAGHHPA